MRRYSDMEETHTRGVKTLSNSSMEGGSYLAGISRFLCRLHVQRKALQVHLCCPRTNYVSIFLVRDALTFNFRRVLFRFYWYILNSNAIWYWTICQSTDFGGCMAGVTVSGRKSYNYQAPKPREGYLRSLLAPTRHTE